MGKEKVRIRKGRKGERQTEKRLEELVKERKDGVRLMKRERRETRKAKRRRIK